MGKVLSRKGSPYSDPVDLLGSSIDNEDEIVDEESEDELLEDDEEEEYRFDWMRLAEMGPNTNIVSSSDLGRSKH